MAITLDLMEYSSDELAQEAYVTDGYLIKDNFDSYNDGDLNGQGGWSGDVEYDVQGTVVQAGAKAVKIANLGANYKCIDHSILAAGDGKLVIWKRVGSTSDADANITHFKEGANIRFYEQFYGGVGGASREAQIVGSGGSTVYGTYSRDTWHKVEVEWRTSDNKCRARLDGGTWSAWIAALTAFTNIDTIEFKGGRYADFYFDTINSSTTLQCYSEDTIIEEGSYSLKIVANQTNSLNKTLTRTVSPTIDLTGQQMIEVNVRASRTGNNFKIGIRDLGGTTTERPVTVAGANTWQTEMWNLSAVADVNKDAVHRIIIIITNADSSNTIYIDNMFAEVELVYEEKIGLLESLPTIERQLTLEEAIALKESIDTPACPDVVLEEAIALAESFEADEQTIVRATATAEFLAEQAKRTNQPVKRIWLYINSTFHDITDQFMSMGPIDRKMSYEPGKTKFLIISNQTLVMSNADKYFSDLNPSSPFYDRDYAGEDEIKVYAGFIIPATGYAEVMQKADTKLMAIKLLTNQGIAHLECQDSFREVFDIYVGMPESDGTPNPLTYTDKTFKYIMDDLLINKAGIASGKVDIEDVSLTFTSVSFEKQKIGECIQELAEVARGAAVQLGDGTVQFKQFVSESTDPDLTLESGKNYSDLIYTGQDFKLKVNKVVVIGASGVYAEAELSGETGITLKYENDLIETVAVAQDIAAECLGRFATFPSLVELRAEYLPSLDLKSVIKTYEPNSMMSPKLLQITELALDIAEYKTRMVTTSLGAAGKAKTWSTKEELEDGTLNNVLVPDGLNRLELKRKQLSGTATYIHDVGSGKIADWKYFDYDKEDSKIILRDQFLENTLSEYEQEGLWSGIAFKAPSWDSVNKRVKFNLGNDLSFTLRPKDLTVQNFILSYDFLGEAAYPYYFGFFGFGRWVNQSNMYGFLVRYPEGWGYPPTSPEIFKIIGGAVSDLKWGSTYFALNTEYQMIVTVNGDSLKVEIPGLAPAVSETDSSLPNAGAVKFGAHQGKGWIDNFLLEHYELPSPAGTTVSFKFWISTNGTDWANHYTDISNVPDSRYIKIEVTMSRESLAKAMPILNNMAVGYFLKEAP